MALTFYLTLSSTVTEATDCSLFYVFDTTTDWGSTVNKADVISAYLKITATTLSSEVEIEITFTAGNFGTDGTSADLFGSGFEVESADVFGTGTDTFTDGYYQIKYEINTASETYTYTNHQGFYCVTRCAIRSLGVNLTVPICDKALVDTYWNLFCAFASMEFAACCGQSDKFEEILNYINNIIAGCNNAAITNFKPGTGCCS